MQAESLFRVSRCRLTSFALAWLHHITHLRPARWFAGMEQFGIDAEELSSALQKRFQGGASVAKLPGKTETGKEVSLQVQFISSACELVMILLQILSCCATLRTSLSAVRQNGR